MQSWSVSSIRQFHQCSLAWFFKRIGVREEFKPVALAEGAAMHEALAHHLRGMQDGKTPTEEESIEILEGAMLGQELEGEVAYGERRGRDTILERLKGLFRHWRANLKIEGTVAGVEQELRVRLPGQTHEMLGFVDLVIDRKDGFEVCDHKVSASRRQTDELLDYHDGQKVAYTRGIELTMNRPVTSWRWSVLTKTVKPAVHEDRLEVRSEDRVAELQRLAAVVNPTVRQMEEILSGERQPVPTQAYARFCGGCPFRMACARWTGAVPQASPRALPALSP
ncbi:MAG: PD-(D/E)XK nuclease family protein [Planctomycetes bacterium]|nr:PD-(D/E)XK nuclease family protein [Planctomycetota bacterium]